MGALTSFEYICSETIFAIRDYKSPFMDINVVWREGIFGFWIDGEEKKEHIMEDKSISKESLAAKSVRMMIEDY